MLQEILLGIYILSLIFISFISSFGLLFYALPKYFKQYSFNISLIFLPLLLIDILSGLSYIPALKVQINYYQYILFFGSIVTFLVLFLHWEEIKKIIFNSFNLIPFVAALISLIGFCYLNQTEIFGHNYLFNGEFFNYSKLAQKLIDPSINIPQFFLNHQKIRYGQDIFLAVVSLIFKQYPLNVFHIVTGYLLFSYNLVASIILISIFGQRVSTYLLILINIFNLLPLFNCNTSWYSSSLVLPIILSILASICTNFKNESWRIWKSHLVLIVLGYIFVAITYPELFVPLVVSLIGFSILLIFYEKKITENSKLIFSSLLCLILVAPLTIKSQIHGFLFQIGVNGGWNILSSPFENIYLFFLNIIGLCYPTAHVHFYNNLVFIKFIFLFLIFSLFYGLVKNFRKISLQLKIILLIWIGFVCMTSIITLIKATTWYMPSKIFIQFSLVLMILYGFSYCKENTKFNFIGLTTILLIYLFSYVGELRHAKKEILYFNLNKMSVFLKKHQYSKPFLVFNDPEQIMIFYLDILNDQHLLHFLSSSVDQQARIERDHFLSRNYEQEAQIERGTLNNNFKEDKYFLDRMQARNSCYHETQEVNRDLSFTPKFLETAFVFLLNQIDNENLKIDYQTLLDYQKKIKLFDFGQYSLYQINFDIKKKITFLENMSFSHWNACLPKHIKSSRIEIYVPLDTFNNHSFSLLIGFGKDFSEYPIQKPGYYHFNITNSTNSNLLQVISKDKKKDIHFRVIGIEF